MMGPQEQLNEGPEPDPAKKVDFGPETTFLMQRNLGLEYLGGLRGDGEDGDGRKEWDEAKLVQDFALLFYGPSEEYARGSELESAPRVRNRCVRTVRRWIKLIFKSSSK